MSDPIHQNAADDDLLANAIPIDDSEETEEEVLEPIEVDLGDVDDDVEDQSSTKIRTFAVQKSHNETWNRTPNTTGTGAIHCKTFVAKLRLDAIEYLDEQVNLWLDEHPEYEVKFVTTSSGPLKGKTTEDALFMTVWV